MPVTRWLLRLAIPLAVTGVLLHGSASAALLLTALALALVWLVSRANGVAAPSGRGAGRAGAAGAAGWASYGAGGYDGGRYGAGYDGGSCGGDGGGSGDSGGSC